MNYLQFAFVLWFHQMINCMISANLTKIYFLKWEGGKSRRKVGMKEKSYFKALDR